MASFKIADLNNKHFLALAGNAVIAVLGVVLVALPTHTLSKADVGTWFFFLMVVALGDAVRNGFLFTGTVKFYAGTTPERSREVLGSVWFLIMVLTGSLALIDAAFMPFIHAIPNRELVVSIRWFGITFLSSMPFTVILWVLVAEEKYIKILWLRMVNSGSMIIYVTILVLLKKMSLEALLWCNFLTNCLTSVVGLLWGLGKVSTIFHRSRASILELAHFGKYSLGSNFTSKLLGSTDTFIINFMLGPAMLAVYSIPLKLMEIVEFPLRSFIGTGLSGMAIAYNNDNVPQATYIMKKYSGMLTMAFIPLTIGAVIFADVAIGVLGGPKYTGTEAANIFRISCWWYA